MKCVVLCIALMAVAIAAPVNVHIVPHTHDDVGWLKTVDQYYSGANNSIQHAAVRLILDTVVQSLAFNPDRKFTYIEQAFFQRWWREQSDHVKDITRRLVKNGQLTFANGGWCMHDEAAAHYIDMIDQTTLGHRFLKEEFDYAPRVGWQLDPFGHSASQAALLSAEVGFDALFFGRIDYQDLDNRLHNKSCETIWRASPSLGPDAQVFSGLTGEYGGNYGPVDGFNWNVDSNDEPIEDNPELDTYNVKPRVDAFVQAALKQASHTRGNNIMMTMGSDFQYESANNWYSNLDRIIKAVNADGRVHALYSSPEIYAAAKYAEASRVEWPVFDGDNADFFPYADGPHQFWTGYFVSRAAAKRYTRVNSALMNAARQLQSFGGQSMTGVDKLIRYEEAMGVNQHHDAISGTAKQHVAFDYAKRLARGQTDGEAVMSQALTSILGDSSMPWAFCRRLNETVCPATQQLQPGAEAAIVAYNQLAQTRTETVLIPVSSMNINIVDGTTGVALPSQVYPAGETLTNYARNTGETNYVAAFQMTLPPVGVSTFKLTPSSTPAPAAQIIHPKAGEDVVLENENVSLHFAGATGRLSSWTNKVTGSTVQVDQQFCYYRSSTGDGYSRQSSGAYIFRPDSKDPSCKPVGTGVATITLVVKGAIVQEVRQTFDSWLTQTVRLAAGARHAEFEFTVGPIDLSDSQSWDGVGREVVSKFVTNIASAGRLLSDSNGREMLHRRRDWRPQWNLTQTEPVAGNYFPINSAVAIADAQNQLTVLVDSAQGAGSIQDGELEVMVHRRLVMDDNRGVGEPLNETQFTTSYNYYNGGASYGPALIVRGRHWVSIESPAQAASIWRPLQDRLYATPVLAFTEAPAVPFTTSSASMLIAPLPPNVQLMTLHSLNATSMLLRLSHSFGINEDAALSKPVQVDLSRLFDVSAAGFKVIGIEEVSLSNNQPKSAILERRRRAMHWNTGSRSEAHSWRMVSPLNFDSDPVVVLGPLEIKTFALTVSYAR